MAPTDTVCKECNNRLNQEVEIPAMRALDFFRSILGIYSRRRGDVIRISANVAMIGPDAPGGLAGQVQQIFLNGEEVPDEVLVFKRKDAAGRSVFEVYGLDKEKLENKRREISRKYPHLQWEKPKDTYQLSSSILVDSDLASPMMRRLAMKVAFERFAQLRGSTALCHSEFDEAREFTLTGREQELSCGVLSDLRYVDGTSNFPIPFHAVMLIEHPYDRIVGAFVSFFSLFYYWVLLSRQYIALAPIDDLLLEDPQARKTENPQLRLGLGSIRVPWPELLNSYRNAPDVIVKDAMRHATQKFQKALETS